MDSPIDLNSITVLPDSRTRTVLTPKNSINRAGAFWVPIYCINCGADGGHVPEKNMTGVSYLCDKCAETHGNIPGTVMIADRVFWERVKQESIEEYGRELTAPETVAALADPASLVSKLARDRAELTPTPGV